MTHAPARLLVDRPHELGLRRGETPKVGDIEHQELAGLARHYGGCAWTSRHQGDLTEELAGAEDQRLRLDLDRHLALGDEVHAVARLAAAGHEGAGRHIVPGPEGGPLGNRR